jgi:methionyl-tRNA formyltransferase
MRLIFAGTPAFARTALAALMARGHTVALVLSQPDRPAGRGQRLTASPVAQLAREHGLPLYQPERLRDPATHAPIAAAQADLMVVAAYGLILPQAVLDLPRLGCLNIHASLLPRWRGAAPVQRAIEAGDPETGIAIMRMEAGLDTGPVLLQRSMPIEPHHTAGSLTEALARLGAECIVTALDRQPDWVAVPQDDSRATYATKINRAEARIDWSAPASLLARRMRAFDPFPGCETSLRGALLKIWSARAVEGSGAPGQVLRSDGLGLRVATGEDALELIEVQRPGGRRIAIREFLAGHPVAHNERFPS